MPDSALDAFDRLCLRVVEDQDGDTASAFLARFQATAASLGPDERIKLNVGSVRENLGLLKAVLADPQANNVCSLCWRYDGKEDVKSVLPRLLSKCPELASLRVNFKLHSTFDFVSRVLEHPRTKLKVLEMPDFVRGSLPKFLAALAQSQVSALTLFADVSAKFGRALSGYLAKDLLVRLKVATRREQVPSELMGSLADCTRLAELDMSWCHFSQPLAFPKSVTKLVICGCTFADGFDGSFLAGSNVHELNLRFLNDVGGNQFGGALAVHLMATGLDKLCVYRCDFANQTLAAVGLELGRIKKLDIDGYLDDASFDLISLVLQSPNSEMKELRLEYTSSTANNIENRLVPALRHPNCHLAKLDFKMFFPGYDAAAKVVENKFRNRRALFVLLQGQQVRRLNCPLRRLPVEMFRLVGEVLI